MKDRQSVSTVDDSKLRDWFCNQVLPLEPALTAYIRRRWRSPDDVSDIRQEIYERALAGARIALPAHTSGYLYTIARNHIANRARRATIVSFELMSDLDQDESLGSFQPEPELIARDELRRALRGLELLPNRCGEVVRLRKVEGLTTREVADRMGIGIDTVEKQLTLGIRAMADFMLGGTGRVKRHTAVGIPKRRKRP